MRSWLDKAVEKSVERFFKDEFPKMLDRELSAIIETHLKKRFAEEPDRELTGVGFGWAMVIALREHWPDLDRHTARDWMWDYLRLAGVRFGAKGYEWTPSAAKELAQCYVEEFGEAA